MTKLSVENLSVTQDQSTLVNNASFSLQQGSFTALIGPNGAGKTSLMRAALGLLPHTGSAAIGDTPTRDLSPQQRARNIAYLPQTRTLAWPNRVRDIVALGRFSHGANMGRLGDLDAAAVQRALAACGLDHLADRRADTLSGGELARVHFARAFATEAPLLVADEPIASLDPRHQFQVLELIKAYVQQGGGALVVLHDIDLAARFASSLIWMKNAEIVAHGPPSETYTVDTVSAVFEVEAQAIGAQIVLNGAR